MKKSWLLMLGILGLALPSGLASAEETSDGNEPVFISLTRTARSMDGLPSNVSVYTQKDIERSGAKTLDEVLDQVTSVDVAKTGTLGSFSTVRMRGVPSSAQTQVVVDDRPVGGTSVQFTDVSQIPADTIERIEVVRGASSVLYGANTIGGVIHVITKRHTGQHARSSIAIDSKSFKTQSYKADVGMAGGGFDGFVNGSRYFTDGFQQNGDADNVSASGNVGYSFSNGGRVSLDISHSNHEVGNPQGTLVPLDQWDGKKERPAADPTARVEQDNNAGRAKVQLPVGSEATIQSTFYGSDQDYQTFPAAGTPASFDQNNRIAGNDTRFTVGGFTLGGAYQRDQQETESTFDPRTANHVTVWGAYVQQSVTLGDLDLIPAVRLDQHSTFGNVVNPRLTTVYRMSDSFKLSANAARSFRAPSFLELFYRSAFFNGNRDLRPETAWTFDLGSEYRLSESRNISVTGFHTRIRERIAATATTYTNAPRAEISGVEVESAGRYGPLTESVNYTYQRAVGNSLASTNFVALRLTPRHMANYRLDWDMPRGFTVSNTVQYVHSQYQFDDQGGIKLPSYTLWNARLAKKILGAELYFAVDNITDKHYSEGFGNDPVFFSTTLLPQPGRTFWGGATIRFLD